MEMLICRATEERRQVVPRPPRKGKTAKDRATGAWGSRFANRAARVEWQKDNRATNGTFPGGNR